MSVKTAGVGHFLIPTAPAAGTSCTSGAANAFSASYVQLIASTSAALYITGIYVEEAAVSAATYIVVQLATGGAGSETVVGQYIVSPSTGSTVTRTYRSIFPPIPVANATRIACKTADSVGAAAKLITLECIAQSNVVDDGIAVGTVTTVTNQLTAAAIATGVWQDATAGDFTVASSIGKSVYIANVAPGASGGHMISGSNAGTTTLGALTITGATTHTGNVVLSDGLTISAPSTLNRAGFDVTGNGTGAALKLAAGATGKGVAITTTAGDGLSILPTAGDAIIATGNGTSKHGARITGGTAGTSDGASFIAGTGGVDFRAAITGNVTGNLSGSVGSVTGAVGSVTGLTASNLDATISSRMATYTQPTGFLAATFPAGTIANTTNITAGTITTTTNVTNNQAKYMNGVVWIDTVNGVVGSTSYTNGILSNPVSNLADAKTIADNLKMKKFYFVAGSSITLAANYGGYVFEGPEWTLALGGQGIALAKFTGATVSGVGTGAGAIFEHCSIGTVTLPTTTINYSGLSGTFTVSATGAYSFDECYNESAAGTDWTLDFGAAVGASAIGLRHFAGGVTVNNMAAGDVLVFSGNGRLTLSASCTAGTVFIRGFIELINNGSGQTITDTSRWNEDQSLASVTGNVGGNVVGSVASVTAGVTVTTNNDKTGYGLSAAAVQAVWDALTTALTTAGSIGKKLADWTIGTAQTGDSFARLGAPAGASVSADIAAVKSDTGAIKTKTDSLTFTQAGQVDANIQYVNDVLVNGDGSPGNEWGP